MSEETPTTDLDSPGDGWAAARQSERLSALPTVYKSTLERLACELALQMEEPEDTFARYGYTPEQAVALMETPAFTVLALRIGKEVKESGLSFKMKARAQAEEYLGHAFEIATDPLAPTAERVKIFQWTCKMAGYEPREKDEAAAKGGFSLNISFAGEAPQKIVANEPLTLGDGNG